MPSASRLPNSCGNTDWAASTRIPAAILEAPPRPAPNPDGEKPLPAPEPVVKAALVKLDRADLDGLRDEHLSSSGGIRGPNLAAPRPLLRIMPGKLGGSPHLLGTRLQTEALAAIFRRGMGRKNIYRLYPRFDPLAIDQALDLENQLTRNLYSAAFAVPGQQPCQRVDW